MKLKNKLILDGILLVLILTCMNYFFTGGLIHEIMGMLVLLGMLFHVIINRKFYAAFIRKISSGTKSTLRLKFSFVINYLMLFSVVYMLFSSVMISQDLFSFVRISDEAYDFFRNSHVLCSVFLLVGVTLHVLLHVKLFINLLRKILSSEKMQKAADVLTRATAIVLVFAVLKMSYDQTMNLIGVDRKAPAAEVAEAESDESEADVDDDTVTEIVKKEDEETVAASETQVPKTTISETEAAENVVSLSEYLGGLNCNGCGRHCSLLSPKCGKGERQAEAATTEYNTLYGNESE